MKIGRLIAIAAFITITATAVAQGTTSPYSAFGYGMLRDHTTSAQRSMGGIGYAMSSGRQINVMNPASHAAIDSLTFLFDMGLDLTFQWQNETNAQGSRLHDTNIGGGLDYATMQFPLGRYMGASVGLLPYSSVGYAFGNEIDNGIASRQGNGNLSELYVALAGKPFKGFTVGANISYLFGTLLNETYGTTETGNYALYQHQMIVRDFHLNFGVQYTLSFNKGDRLTAGLTYSPAKTLLGDAHLVYYDPSSEVAPAYDDKYEQSLRGNYSLPETWGAGLNYHWQRKLMVEFDYTYQPWSKARFNANYGEYDVEFTGTEYPFANRSKYALGLQYTPDPRGGYFKRVNYRLGAYRNDDYLKFYQLGTGAVNNLREYGLSCGFGFPVPTFKSTVNLGFEWINRRAYPQALVTENYFNITLGVNFNEMWFRQSKIY